MSKTKGQHEDIVRCDFITDVSCILDEGGDDASILIISSYRNYSVDKVIVIVYVPKQLG